MLIDVLSLFPNSFKGPFSESILKRAQENKLIEINLSDVRDYSTDKHKQVDDRPYGGGPGMVMMVEPTIKAIRDKKREKSKTIYLSPQGKPLDAKLAKELSKEEHLILLCGHYEGIDQRIIDLEVDQEISIGDYVLTNGCIAACVLVDAIVRFIPGVLGDEESFKQDSFENKILDCPHYTRPQCFEGKSVPEVLLSGHHKNIDKWRKDLALKKTKKNRPDLLHVGDKNE